MTNAKHGREKDNELERAMRRLNEVIAATPNELPTLRRALDVVARSGSSTRVEASVMLLASCVTVTVGQMAALHDQHGV